MPKAQGQIQRLRLLILFLRGKLDGDLRIRRLQQAHRHPGGSFAVNTEDAQITVMSDDSGLVIDALGGEPGIYSARYLGHDTDYNYKMEQIMKRMEDVPEEKRTARFVAAVGAIFPDGTEHVATGAMEGRIAHGIYGQNGFGYDPFFYLPEYGKTSAEITEEQKNAISHRGKALRAMLNEFSDWRAAQEGSAGGR